MNEQLLLITLLMFKHFICDFLLQRPYQYLNKGTFGHPGGVLHAANHLTGTFCILAQFTTLPLTIAGALFDGIAHYFIDWGKVNITKKYFLTPTNSEVYWYLLGFDQLLHFLTYIAIIYYISY